MGDEHILCEHQLASVLRVEPVHRRMIRSGFFVGINADTVREVHANGMRAARAADALFAEAVILVTHHSVQRRTAIGHGVTRSLMNVRTSTVQCHAN